MSQRSFELGVTVFVSGLLEFRGLDAGTGQEQLVGHSTERDAGRGGRHREEGRAIQDAAQYPGVLRVDRRARGRDVDGTAQGIGLYGVHYGADHIVERDPRPVLPARPDLTSPSELEDGERRTERPAFGTEHDAEPRV